MQNYLLAATVPEKFSTKTNRKKMKKMGMEGRKMDRFSVTDIILLYLKRKKNANWHEFSPSGNMLP